MQKISNQSLTSRALETAVTFNNLFPPLETILRPTVPTDTAAYYLNRAPQTLRKWACLENGPIRPIRINGRLAWRVSDLQVLLEGNVSPWRQEHLAKPCTSSNQKVEGNHDNSN